MIHVEHNQNLKMIKTRIRLKSRIQLYMVEGGTLLSMSVCVGGISAFGAFKEDVYTTELSGTVGKDTVCKGGRFPLVANVFILPVHRISLLTAGAFQ